NLFDQSINQCKITKNLSQNVVHSDSDLILHNSSVLIDKEPIFFGGQFSLKNKEATIRKLC
ncbi:hypothetical protein NMC70_13025, partial [Enterococcus faecium]|nr:hypothetical protein [Enterococcus faecium]MCA6686664.1 hypothetical protein [Enterococcus faecium]MCA6695322.1 hypothetical protein [Enterococcus faecium]MCA6709138.1 hypothetical protein [Enterococcus faecium]MCA6759766.1 hypothetical protein [Enterococcus faecium]